MKRVKQVGLFAIMAVLVLSVAGCTNSAKTNEKEEGIMQEYATTYYNEHMLGVDTDVAQITIQMFQDINELGREEQYDLSDLSKCTSESYVDLIINSETKDIESYEFHMTCD